MLYPNMTFPFINNDWGHERIFNELYYEPMWMVNYPSCNKIGEFYFEGARQEHFEWITEYNPYGLVNRFELKDLGEVKTYNMKEEKQKQTNVYKLTKEDRATFAKFGQQIP